MIKAKIEKFLNELEKIVQKIDIIFLRDCILFILIWIIWFTGNSPGPGGDGPFGFDDAALNPSVPSTTEKELDPDYEIINWKDYSKDESDCSSNSDSSDFDESKPKFKPKYISMVIFFTCCTVIPWVLGIPAPISVLIPA